MSASTATDAPYDTITAEPAAEPSLDTGEATDFDAEDDEAAFPARVKLEGLRLLDANGTIDFDEEEGVIETADGETHEMGQMGAKRIGQLAIGIGVVGIVLNEMSNMDMVSNSTGVVDVSSIFNTAGSGLDLLVLGVIIAAAAVLLSLWSGF